MPLQDVLAGFQNPAASRAAILARLNIDPNRAGGYGGNTQFDQQMADLYTQGLRSAAQYDTEEGDLNRGYEKNLAQAAIDRDRALEVIKGNFAHRGMSFSGANVDEVGRATGDYNRYVENLGADKEAGLGAIGRNRLNLEEGLRSGRMAAESGYGADLSAFLQKQAIDLWNSVLQQNAGGGMGGYGGGGGGSRPSGNPDPHNWAGIAAAMQSAPRPTAQAPSYNVLSGPKTGTPVKKPITPLRGQGYGGRGPF